VSIFLHKPALGLLQRHVCFEEEKMLLMVGSLIALFFFMPNASKLCMDHSYFVSVLQTHNEILI